MYDINELISELEEATNEIIKFRSWLMTDEKVRLTAKHEADDAAAVLARYKTYAMASEDAGKNDATRKAHAEVQTTPERVRLEEAEAKLLDAELHVIEHTAELRMAEDRRRYLETVARLMTAEVVA